MDYLRFTRVMPGIVMVMCLGVTTGCVTQRSATVTGIDGEKSLQLKRVTTGLLAGPCVPAYPGRSSETYWLGLQGDGPTYSARQLSFMNDKGDFVPVPESLSGEVRVDRSKHLVVVDIHQGDLPMPYNGAYRYKGDL